MSIALHPCAAPAPAFAFWHAERGSVRTLPGPTGHRAYPQGAASLLHALLRELTALAQRRHGLAAWACGMDQQWHPLFSGHNGAHRAEAAEAGFSGPGHNGAHRAETAEARFSGPGRCGVPPAEVAEAGFSGLVTEEQADDCLHVHSLLNDLGVWGPGPRRRFKASL